MMKWLATAAALLLLTACGVDNVTAPAPTGPQYAVHVSAHSQLVGALQQGKTWIIIDAPISFYTAADAIDVDALLPMWAGNVVTIEAGGDWGSGQINRMGSFAQPLIRFRHTRDWEVHVRGLRFDGWNLCGPALDVGYAQLSTFDNIVVQRFDCPDPFSAGRYGALSATEFRDVQLNWNNYPAVLYNAADVRWRGGAIQSTWAPQQWNSGLVIIGQPHNPPLTVGGPVLVEDLHAEGSDLVVKNVHEVTVLRGYWHVANARLSNNVGVHFDCNGLFTSGGGLYVNGVRMCQEDK